MERLGKPTPLPPDHQRGKFLKPRYVKVLNSLRCVFLWQVCFSRARCATTMKGCLTPRIFRTAKYMRFAPAVKCSRARFGAVLSLAMHTPPRRMPTAEVTLDGDPAGGSANAKASSRGEMRLLESLPSADQFSSGFWIASFRSAMRGSTSIP